MLRYFFYYDRQSSLQYYEATRNGLFQVLDVLFIKDDASCCLSEPCTQHWATFFEEAQLGDIVFLQALGVRFSCFSR